MEFLDELKALMAKMESRASTKNVELEEKIIALAAQGLCMKEIGALVGKSPENVRYYLVKNNLPTKPSKAATPIEDESEESDSDPFEDSEELYEDEEGLRVIVILPDAHAKPKGRNETFDPNARFRWFGRYVNEIRPTRVVCLGDFADMESLSSYDKGKASFEGRRYKKDLKAAIDAQKAMFGEIENREEITFDMLYGNHEVRINRAVNDDPYLDETLSLDDLKYKEYWDNVYDFKTIAMIEGIGFSHYFPNGLMDRPIGGENVAKGMLKKHPGFSLVAGHRHDFQLAFDTLADGRQVFGLVAGCFLDLDQHETYVSQTIQRTWKRCITVLTETASGSWDIEVISLERLRDAYGD